MGGGVTKADLLTPFECRLLERIGSVPKNLRCFADAYTELLKEWDVTREEKKELESTMVDTWINLCTHQFSKAAKSM